MIVDIDGIELDISEFDKKITYHNDNGEVVITYELNFPPHRAEHKFNTDEEAQEFITQIKKEGDPVKYF
jgi:hypothetical protein